MSVIADNMNSSLLAGRAVLDSVVASIVIIDEEGIIQAFNPGAEKLFGYTMDEAIGQNVAILMPEPDRSRHAQYLMEYLRSKQAHIIGLGREVVARHRDGSILDVELQVNEMQLEGRRLFNAVLRDVTAQKRAEAELRELNENLEGRVFERTRELEIANRKLRDEITRRIEAEKHILAAKEEAEEANRAKSEFLSAMSHELRTPMNAILGFAQLLGVVDADSLSDTQKEYLDELCTAGNHLLELINEILDLSRIEAGRMDMDLEAVALHEVFNDCMGMIQPMARKFQVSVGRGECNEAETWVRADRTRLKQVLINLLSNAIKYNQQESGGTVQVTCRHLPGKRVRIEVRDNGPGLTQSQIDRLFQPFERLSVDRNIEGTGIGLALTKRLVESMAGEVGVESQPNQGSNFWIILNQSPPQATERATAE